MTRLLAILLLLPAIASAAGLGVYNPAQHAVNGFMPTQLPGLQFWLDASRLAGFTNGQSVATVSDFSGFGRSFTNSENSKQPTYSSTTFNGRPAIKFDGVDDFMRSDAQIAIKEQVVAMVFRHRTDTANLYARFFAQVCTVCGDDFSLTIVPILAANSTNAVGSWRGGVQATHTINHNENVVFAMTLTTSGNLTNYKNGIAVGANVAAQNFTNKNNFIGNAAGAGSAFANADIAEVVVLNKALNADVQQQLQRYLGTKYGIVVQ